MNKRLLILAIILLILIIILIFNLISMGIFSFLNKPKSVGTKTASEYQIITLQEIESQKNKLDGKKVEYTGILELMFETSNLDGKIWLETLPTTIFIPNQKEFPGYDSSYYQAKVRVYGTLMTKKGIYGHNGSGIYQINADKIELLEKLPMPGSNISETKTFSEIPGFSFDYPVFKGWEVNLVERISDNEYSIVLNNPPGIAFEVAPQIFVTKEQDATGHEVPGLDYSINSKNVKYYPIGGYDSPQSEGIVFFNNDKDFVVMIKPFLHEGGGYSGKVLADKIINSFEFTK